MKPLLLPVHLLLLLFGPVLLVGIVNRTKARWAGRRGPGLLQSGWDLLRLLRKQPVLSQSATPLSRAGAWVVLVAALLAAAIAPLLGAWAPLAFRHDFVAFAYTLALARLALTLAALDAGSAFEGMGAAREAGFASVAEPALFLLIGALSLATGETSFAGLFGRLHQHPAAWLLLPPALVVLLILLQTESARVPVDDPQTHLELTMVHEVMVLDHSGPELAAMQYAAALKMLVYAGLAASLLNPFDPQAQPLAALAAALVLLALVGVVVGCIESLVARLPMRRVPRYLLLAGCAAVLCLALAATGSA